MLFTSISFLYYFLPVVIILYFAMPKKVKNVILLIASLIFYFYGEPKYIFLMLAEIIIAYFGAILIDKYKSKKLLILILTIHLGLLGIFKYADFTIKNINFLFKSQIPLLKLALPIGISFFTFQIISYIVDVYNGKVKVQKSFIKLATYVSLFPQLIAGPIVRYETIENELENRTHSFENFAYGVRRFILGLSKKVLIANMLGELCSNFMSVTEKSVVLYWMFGIGYMLQIYFDFSGYSDIAIGLGRIFGFHFPENFDYPYTAKTITEFWRKWHMTLSSWFRDYVYIPLGGNRRGVKIQIRNILIVWALTGLWHGASWNFVLWGSLFGVILILEKFVFNKLLEKSPNIIKRIYTLFIVMISFVIFQSTDMSQIGVIIKGLFGLNNEALINATTLYYLKGYAVIIILGIIGSTPLLRNLVNKLSSNSKWNKIINILQPIYMILLLGIVTIFLVDNSYNPFLYFRF